MPPRRTRIMGIWIAAIALIGVIPQARAESDFSSLDVATGDELAHRLCINCHVVDAKGPVVRTDQVPSFSWIAQEPGLTPALVSGWISTAHERMPDYTLTREEIRQLTAYIYSLRSKH